MVMTDSGSINETQDHLLEECTSIHGDPNNPAKIVPADLFIEDTGQLKIKAKKLERIEEIIDQWEKALLKCHGGAVWLPRTHARSKVK